MALRCLSATVCPVPVCLCRSDHRRRSVRDGRSLIIGPLLMAGGRRQIRDSIGSGLAYLTLTPDPPLHRRPRGPHLETSAMFGRNHPRRVSRPICPGSFSDRLTGVSAVYTVLYVVAGPEKVLVPRWSRQHGSWWARRGNLI